MLDDRRVLYALIQIEELLPSVLGNSREPQFIVGANTERAATTIEALCFVREKKANQEANYFDARSLIL